MLLNILTSTFLVAGVQAIGRAIITNQCDLPVYVWSVGNNVSQQYTLGLDQSYSEVFHTDPGADNTSLIFSTMDGGFSIPNTSHTVFTYTLKGDQVEYELDDVVPLYQYNLFSGETVKITATDPNCNNITWGNGRPPAEKQVESCQAGSDLELSFCTGHCLPAWFPCGSNAPPGDTRQCCTHCIGDHHCIAVSEPV
ncbi:hypothetical protein P153DRAFT_427035 [Dothidotthia symphoricarpi CBS 119687]|uniref:BYS1 domain protein n=1 Tax=Dothidotthia symphoricarpi CBS 119687 TaxID=1392245 RepID=A0A6A5ZWF8_9PLEO|nr:uncharacterized protein P153DRAFT_427035 [Dothidotthia symphoricarpi CBS 119687]KAF2123375.1 hypothetical protein P153DRAFT_427035 [Dothidotthia symphoricarpi CBS 119687]